MLRPSLVDNDLPGSGDVACTVKMANLGSHADVAVIDEIQIA
jgi:hypothetical protein